METTQATITTKEEEEEVEVDQKAMDMVTQEQEEEDSGPTIEEKINKFRNHILNFYKNTDGDEDFATMNEYVMSSLHDFVGSRLAKALEKQFGNNSFRVTVVPFTKPYLNSSSKNDYRHVLKSLEWTDGPSAHQVYFYIKEKHKYYLENPDHFDEEMYIRNISNINKRYTSFYLPIAINGKEFNAIEVLVIKVVDATNKIRYYSIEAVDEKLDIKDVRGKTKEAALSKFQTKLEGVYWMERYSEAHKALMKKLRQQSSSNSTAKGISTQMLSSSSEQQEPLVTA